MRWFSSPETTSCCSHYPRPCRSARQGWRPASSAAIHDDSNARSALEVQWNSDQEKLLVDFGPITRLRVTRDPVDLALIDNLCIRIWMIMEDTSAVAPSVRSLDQEGQRIAIMEIARTSAKIVGLIGAVHALIE
jgi:hypothetical protein